MTARFFRRAISWDDYRARIDLTPPANVEPPQAQYNIAPSQIVPILRRAPEGEYAPRFSIQIAPAFWGLVPAWWKKPLSEKTFSTFNARADTLAELEGEGRVVLRYEGHNPNGSLNDIAGIANAAGNVVGLMPHPEHAVEEGFGPGAGTGTDGLAMFTSALGVLVNA